MISFGLKTRNQHPIGLDIGHNSIKMIQLSASSDKISVASANEIRIDPNIKNEAEKRNFIISSIKQMLEEGDFRGRNVVSCLSNDELKIINMRLSESESNVNEEVLAKEASQRFGLSSDNYMTRYIPVGSVKHGDELKNEFIMFVASNDSVKKHIELLEEAHLTPVAIDTIPAALLRSSEKMLRRQDDKDYSAVFVDIGSRFTTVVFERDGEISFLKQIEVGGDRFSQEVASRLNIGISEARVLREMLRSAPEMNRVAVKSAAGNATESSFVAERTVIGNKHKLDASTRQMMIDAIGFVAQQLAREISLCFRYYTVTFRGKRIERAVFAGGEAYEDILLNFLRRQLTVDIEVAQPLRGFDITNANFSSDKRGLLCEWTIAVGLALKGLN